jgi:hypothetical protein
MLFKEVIAVYSENHTKPINIYIHSAGKKADLMIVQAGGTYNYHCALKSWIKLKSQEYDYSVNGLNRRSQRKMI